MCSYLRRPGPKRSLSWGIPAPWPTNSVSWKIIDPGCNIPGISRMVVPLEVAKTSKMPASEVDVEYRHAQQAGGLGPQLKLLQIVSGTCQNGCGWRMDSCMFDIVINPFDHVMA